MEDTDGKACSGVSVGRRGQLLANQVSEETRVPWTLKDKQPLWARAALLGGSRCVSLPQPSPTHHPRVQG